MRKPQVPYLRHFYSEAPVILSNDSHDHILAIFHPQEKTYDSRMETQRTQDVFVRMYLLSGQRGADHLLVSPSLYGLYCPFLFLYCFLKFSSI